jgi:2,4-dienoyl-CoA reductase-like NADH-dependent reductase (Old Yellow Enzyme family)
MADEQGCPTPALSRLYGTLAKGGVGLLIAGFAYVRSDGKPADRAGGGKGS